MHISVHGNTNPMTYVDRHAGNASMTQNPDYHPLAQFGVALRNLLRGAHSALSSFLAYLANARGPTPSASALVYGGVAAAGTVLYEAWTDTAAVENSSRGLVCERGCLRRFTNALHLKAADEIRLHQDVLGRHFKRRYVGGPWHNKMSSLRLSRIPPEPR